MRSAHDEQRAAQIRSVHCPTRRGRHRVCVACGQSWPCTDYAWATWEPPRWSRGDTARALAVAVAVFVGVPILTYRLLPAWAWAALLALVTLAGGWTLVALSRRRPE